MWWAEIRASRAALTLVALLVAGTAALVAAVPAKTARADQWTTTDVLARGSYAQRDLVWFATTAGAAPTDAALVAGGRSALALLPPALRSVVSSTEITTIEDWYLPLTGASAKSALGLPPFLRVTADTDFRSKVRFVAGAAPTTVVVPSAGNGAADAAARVDVPIAVSQATADTLGLAVGTTVDVRLPPPPRSAAGAPRVVLHLVVAGIYVPTAGPGDAMWNKIYQGRGPVKSMICPDGGYTCLDGETAWLADVLVADSRSVDLVAGLGSRPARTYWDYVVDPARVPAGRIDAVAAELAGVRQGETPVVDPAAAFGGVSALNTDLPSLIQSIKATEWSSRVVDGVVLGGAAAGEFAALFLVLRMTVTRRAREIALLKARGAAPARLAARGAGQVAIVALLAGSAGAVGGAWADQGSIGAVATWYGAAGGVVAALGVVGFLVWRQPEQVVPQRHEGSGGGSGGSGRFGRFGSSGGSGESGGFGGATANRAVRDIGVGLAALAAVGVYRFEGTGETVGRIDWFAVLAPGLLAFAAGIAAVRLVPVLLRPLAALARRGRGTIGFLGTTLAGRRSRAVAAPLVGLVAVIASGVFAADYDASVTTRARADALRQVGADAQVRSALLDDVADPSGDPLDPAFAARAAALPGVRHVSTAWMGSVGSDFPDPVGNRAIAMIVVDAADFRALVADEAGAVPGQIAKVPDTWAAASPAPAPTPAPTPTHRPADALVSPNLAATVGGAHQIQFAGYAIDLSVKAAVDLPLADSLYRHYGPAYVIVPRADLPAATTFVTTAVPIDQTFAPTLAWMTGTPTEAALRTLPGVTPHYRVALREPVLAAMLASGQVSAARGVFHLVEALSVGCFALCLLLLLAATGGVARDTALLAQVFGLRARGSRLVALIVPLPIVLTGLAAGLGAGVALSPLLGPLTRGGDAATESSSILATTPIGYGWVWPAAGVAVALAAVGIGLDLLLRRSAELSIRLRAAEYE